MKHKREIIVKGITYICNCHCLDCKDDSQWDDHGRCSKCIDETDGYCYFVPKEVPNEAKNI